MCVKRGGERGREREYAVSICLLRNRERVEREKCRGLPDLLYGSKKRGDEIEIGRAHV